MKCTNMKTVGFGFSKVFSFTIFMVMVSTTGVLNFEHKPLTAVEVL